MPIPEAEEVANHRHHRERPRKSGSSLQPRLGGAALEPQHFGEVVASRVLQRVLEHFHLVQQREHVVVGCHLQHEPVLDVERDFARLPVVADERVQRVAVGNPANEAGIGRERHNRISTDRQSSLSGVRVVSEQVVHQPEQLHDALILPQVLVTLEQIVVIASIGAVNEQAPWALLARDDRHGGREGADCDCGCAGEVVSGHCELQILCLHKLGADVVELEGGESRELLVYEFEDVVIEVPRLAKLWITAGNLVALAPLVRLLQFATVRVDEANLLERLGAVLLKLTVQRRERSEHAIHVLLDEV
mmetsp:Transcript_30070/g.97887  ORF Transcript_30070/g.97887 Transcript_30070/m.97887 type:complete len:305 (+) Transcript_30070:3296-4210(+)